MGCRLIGFRYRIDTVSRLYRYTETKPNVRRETRQKGTPHQIEIKKILETSAFGGASRGSFFLSKMLDHNRRAGGKVAGLWRKEEPAPTVGALLDGVGAILTAEFRSDLCMEFGNSLAINCVLPPREPIYNRFSQPGQSLFNFLGRGIGALDVPHHLPPQPREPFGAIYVAVSRSFKVEGREPHGRGFQLSSIRIRGAAFRSDVRRYAVEKGWPEGRDE